MSYEPSSKECRKLIEAKSGIENIIRSFGEDEELKGLTDQLVSIYNELEKMHDKRRMLRN